jgi:hypothetical protein
MPNTNVRVAGDTHTEAWDGETVVAMIPIGASV